MVKVAFQQNDFLIFYAVVVILVVGSFYLIRREPKAPTQLDLGERKPDSPIQVQKAAPPPQRKRPMGWNDYRPRQETQDHYRGKTDDGSSGKLDDTAPGFQITEKNAPQTAAETSLNVLFNWNGHTWDAYEVLGVPAGSSKTAIEAAYHLSRARADADSLKFLEAAYQAIQRKT